jgi:hypothetical protein
MRCPALNCGVPWFGFPRKENQIKGAGQNMSKPRQKKIESNQGGPLYVFAVIEEGLLKSEALMIDDNLARLVDRAGTLYGVIHLTVSKPSKAHWTR